MEIHIIMLSADFSQSEKYGHYSRYVDTVKCDLFAWKTKKISIEFS